MTVPIWRSALVCLACAWQISLSACASDSTIVRLEQNMPAAGSSEASDAGSPSFARGCPGGACNVDSGASPLSPSCANAARLALPTPDARTVLVASGSTQRATDTSQSDLGACDGATSGPDVTYLLDLSRMNGPVDVRGVLDADFDAALDLRRGPCGDSVSLACDRASATGSNSSSIGVRLDPGTYWLAVDGRDAASRGSFRVQLEVDARDGTCPEPEATSSCGDPIPLDASDRSTSLLDLECPPVDDDERAFYFELDLRAEPAAVLTTVSSSGFSGKRRFARLNLYRADDAAVGCGALVTEGYGSNGESPHDYVEVEALLPPERHVIELQMDRLDAAGEPSPAMLGVRLDRERCRLGPRGNSCATAIPIAMSSGVQVVTGDTSCNANHLTVESCQEAEAPDQFHRLDLSAETGLTRARLALLADGVTFAPLLYVLSAGDGQTCGEALYCLDSYGKGEGLPSYELLLPPDVYFIGVDGEYVGAAGAYQLFLELLPGATRPCVDSRILQCLIQNQPLCCDSPADAGCARTLELCGLDSATTSCVCGANPACCGAEGSRDSCPQLFASCGYLCSDFEPSGERCAQGYR